MQPRADDEGLDGCISQRLTGFEAVDALDQDETVLAPAHQDRAFFIRFHNFFCDNIDPLRIQFPATIRGYVNFVDIHGDGFKQFGALSIIQRTPYTKRRKGSRQKRLTGKSK